jgi:outer membrane lipoprotein-sorting protein
MKRFLIIIMFLSVAVSAQTKDAKKIIDAVRQKFNKVNDYQADVTIKLNMSAIKVPDMKAKVSFKVPDKLKVDSEGFAMLPKQGLKFSPADFFKGEYTPLYVRSDMLDNRKVDVVKTIPNNDSTEIILTTLWIDTEGLVVRKVETTTKKGGTTQVLLSYDNYEFGLPSQVNISFNMGEVKAPANLPKTDNDSERGERRRGMPGGVSLSGSVIMKYKNYKVNIGLPDSFFESKEKKK